MVCSCCHCQQETASRSSVLVVYPDSDYFSPIPHYYGHEKPFIIGVLDGKNSSIVSTEMHRNDMGGLASSFSLLLSPKQPQEALHVLQSSKVVRLCASNGGDDDRGGK